MGQFGKAQQILGALAGMPFCMISGQYVRDSMKSSQQTVMKE